MAAAGAGAVAAPAGMFSGGDDVLKIGLIGCGGRGTAGSAG